MKLHIFLFFIFTTFNYICAYDGIITDSIYVKTCNDAIINIAPSTNEFFYLGNNRFLLPKESINKFDNKDIIFTSPIINTKLGDKFAYDNCLILYDVIDIHDIINKYNLKNNVIDIDSIVGEPLIYLLYVKNYNCQQLESLCNRINNSGLCKNAELDFLILSEISDSTSITPSSNPYFNNQWGLYNRPSSDNDINVIEAWKHSVG